MTHDHPAAQHSHALHSSQVQGAPNMPEMSFRKRKRNQDRNALLKAALWRAFPDATSENDLSIRAAAAMLKEGGEDITDRGIRKWLNGDALPRAKNMAALGILIGSEAAMDILFGKDTR